MTKLKTLEAVRSICAFYVVLSHLLIAGLKLSGPISVPFRFGQEAVIVFFLLSGFVIAVSTNGQAPAKFWPFAFKRWLRIYPIFFLSLALAAAANAYFSFGDAIGNILMLQDFQTAKPGVLFPTFGGNIPLWSLSYEWWFYMLFVPTTRWIPERYQTLIVTITALLAVGLYNLTHFQPFLFIAYYPLWWAGVELARAYLRQQSFPLKTLVSVGSLAAAFAISILLTLKGSIAASIGVHPVLEVRHSVFAILALCATLLLWRKSNLLDERLISALAAPASISYGVYVLHFPIVTSVWWGSINVPVAVRVMVTVLLVVTLAVFAEGPYQTAWKTIFRRLTDRSGSSHTIR